MNRIRKKGTQHISEPNGNRNLLGVNYCVDYLLNNGLHCAKLVHSQLLFGLIFVWTEKINNWLCIHFRGCLDGTIHAIVHAS